MNKSRIKNGITLIKKYTETIGLSRNEWVKVAIDYVNCAKRYGFNLDDYCVIGNGYTLSRYEKERFFSIKRSAELQRKVNNPNYIHCLENKAEALTLFQSLVRRKWLYATTASLEEFMSFVSSVPVFIAKPVEGSCGKGIEKHDVRQISRGGGKGVVCSLQRGQLASGRVYRSA